MWRPSPTVKHALPLVEPISADEARRARWFQPLDRGRLSVETRTWIPAMVPWRASEDGRVTPRVIDWYRRFAEGRPGAIVIEATGIRDVPSGPLLRIGHDRFLPGLRELCEAIREASDGHTRVFIQLIDFLRIRRRPTGEAFLGRYLSLTERHRAATGQQADADVRAALLALDAQGLEEVLDERELEALRFGARQRVTDVDDPQIRDLPQTLPPLFAAAAARAERAGFDGVELHYAHAYTMASFLSAKNDRRDGYGGTREQRVRLPLEVFDAVRSEVGPAFVVGARFLADEIIDGGSHVADAGFFAESFARAGFDFLSLSRGGKFEDAKQPRVGAAAYPYTGRSGFECMPTVRADERGPFSRNVPDAGEIRRRLKEAGLDTPLVVAGGISTLAQAEAILSEDIADIVASARQSLADPDWFLKLAAGRAEDVRRCQFTNYCEGLDQMHKPVTCQLWDRKGLDEPDIDIHDGRRLIAPRNRQGS